MDSELTTGVTESSCLVMHSYTLLWVNYFNQLRFYTGKTTDNTPLRIYSHCNALLQTLISIICSGRCFPYWLSAS